ncbi:RNA polymerase sigma factor [Pedobacter sp. MC2016-24]|uniref:RNA polymerase sigma factor n=1 Tax=Pedobacter sp. MC2016-24 TaxID=2780090 RepID=UPI001881FDF2|nr:sigma-70 family RNA polymerase sigma factor [Pedobacter sp. MC2016-24]MBE9601515.1 sigma-70 family RNA polymerase sigma factor [Pedobacter sp. MC2016-24]
MDKVYELTELWDNSIKGEEQSFALLHKSLYPCLFNYAVKMIKDEDLADDMLQDLFIKFWQNKSRIGSIVNVKAYFYRSVRSMTLNHIKSQQLRDAKLEAMPVPDMEFSKEEIMLSHEIDAGLKSSMTQALNRLPAKQREVIYMHFYDKLDYTQIAEITGTKYQSVVNSVYRAVQVLREVPLLKDIYAL